MELQRSSGKIRLHGLGGGGGNLVLFMVRRSVIFRGTFSNRYGIMGIFFTIFITFIFMKISSCKGTLPGQTLKIAFHEVAALLMILLTAKVC